MAIKRDIPKKAPSQKPTDFYQSKQQGGAYGSPSGVPLQQKSGPMREKMQKKGL